MLLHALSSARDMPDQTSACLGASGLAIRNLRVEGSCITQDSRTGVNNVSSGYSTSYTFGTEPAQRGVIMMKLGNELPPTSMLTPAVGVTVAATAGELDPGNPPNPWSSQTLPHTLSRQSNAIPER